MMTHESTKKFTSKKRKPFKIKVIKNGKRKKTLRVTSL